MKSFSAMYPTFRIGIPSIAALLVFGTAQPPAMHAARRWPACHARITSYYTLMGAHHYDWVTAQFTVESTEDTVQHHCYIGAWSDDNSLVAVQSPDNSYSTSDFDLDPEGLGTVYAYFRAGDEDGDTYVNLGIGSDYGSTPVDVYSEAPVK